MNKSNLIYRDDSEYLNDMFAYLSLYLTETEKNKGKQKPDEKSKASSCYQTILDRIEMNEEAAYLPRMERLISSVPDQEAKGFLRRFLTLLIKRKLNRPFCLAIDGVFSDAGAKDPRDGSRSGFPTLSDYMDLLWQKKSGDTFEVDRYRDYLYIKDFIELVFPELHEADDLLNVPIEADIRLVDYLTGRDVYIPPGTKRMINEAAPALLFMDDIIKKEQEAMSSISSRILLWGESGGGKKSSLLSAAASKDMPVIFFYMAKNDQAQELQKALCYAEREAFFYHGNLVICGMEHIPDEAEFINCIENTPEALIPNIFFLMDTDTEPEQSKFPRIHVGDYDDGERQKLWETFFSEEENGLKTEEEIDLGVLASTFILTPGKMKNAIAEVKRTEDGTITKRGLYAACYDQLGHILNDKASRIVTTMDWEDLKLGDNNKSYLRDICNSIQARHEVHYKWNFKKKLPYGEGISIVFSGPPGTGKTMAAGVLANELGMEIYRIDLSQIMDKYVGETEKNIKSIFTSASKMSCILFFDEADALFNKRMTAEGANERFANIESALLLQCIEEYNGISILATNDIGRIDSAFMRRFKYHIVFKNPDEAIRQEIWKSVFPKEAPLSKDIDFPLLAKSFDISGALIKNIAVASAYLASCAGKEIGMKEISKAAMRELEKNRMAISSEARYCFEMYLY